MLLAGKILWRVENFSCTAVCFFVIGVYPIVRVDPPLHTVTHISINVCVINRGINLTQIKFYYICRR
jgi:hypothetical protein